ncbi:signal recognition particle 19 kDa protein-like [Limulus polyphemus]|uniref:Signal recognition particle 19 kDa protein-like n=1 Tax=Limulus polyphemus TaxID=6850 RepID=A0ABM1BU90_LIMPO|nr:signal recognition particle 19 kDa protein-like [Limulus polyphemus]
MAVSSWSPDKKHSDKERWVCVYPAYINSKKTVFEGRRLPKTKCVENPTYQEIRDVLDSAGFKVGVENKLYPRETNKDELIYKGRIRFQLKKDDGSPVNLKFPTRKSVLVYLCEMIPKLKSRTQKQSGGDQSHSVQGGGKKGKGKKGKR